MDIFEGKILDGAYDEMMNWSGMDTGFVHDILNAAEEDDNAYLIVLKWLNAEGPNERKMLEGIMAEYLLIGQLLR